MQYKITKSYRLLRFINADHSRVARVFWGGLAWIGCIAIARDQILAREAFLRFARDDNFKTGFRRMAWYFRRGWPRLDVGRDHMYDFTELMDRHELAALERFVQRRQSATDPLVHDCDMMFIHARILMSERGAEDWDVKLSRFCAQADEVLKKMPPEELATTAKPAPVAKRKGDFSQDSARTALADFAGLFPIDDVPWYVISGTLLGLVREGGFLAHDYDIDLGIHAEDASIDQLVRRIDSSNKFTLRKNDVQQELFGNGNGQPVKLSRPVLVKLVHASGVSIDIFLHYLDGDIRWHGSSLHRWENTDFSLTEYDLCGVRVLGPTDAPRYLEENYGDWRTPVTEFDCTTDTNNQSVVNAPPSIALFLRRMAVGFSKKAGDAAEVRRLLTDCGYLEQTSDGPRLVPARLLPPAPADTSRAT